MNTEIRPKIVPLTTMNSEKNMTTKFDWAEKKRMTEEQIRQQNEENLRNISQKAFRETLAQTITLQELMEIMQNDPQLLEFCGNIRIQSVTDEIRTRSSLTPAKTGIKRARIKFVEHDGVRLSERGVFLLKILAKQFKMSRFLASSSLSDCVLNLLDLEDSPFKNLEENTLRSEVHRLVNGEFSKLGIVFKTGEKEHRSFYFKLNQKGMDLASTLNQQGDSVILESSLEDEEVENELTPEDRSQLQEDIENAVALEASEQ